MNPLANMSTSTALSRLKQDLKSLHSLTKKDLNPNTWPEIMKLTRDILNCAQIISPILQEPLRTDLLGLVEDFDDYTLDSSPDERHQFQNYLNNNLRSVIERIDQTEMKQTVA